MDGVKENTLTMRVLLVTGSFPPMKCGVGDYTYSLASSLSGMSDLDVAVLTDVKADLSTNENIKVFSLIDGKIRNLFQVVWILRNWRPDIVHFQYPTMGYKKWKGLHIILPILVWFMKISVLMTWHEPFRVHRSRIINTVVLATFGLVIGGLIYVRPNYLDLLPKWSLRLMMKKRCRFIGNASTIPTCELSKEDELSIRERYVSGHKKLVVYFGFAFPNKKIEQIFEIANPERDYIVLICDLNPSYQYHKKIQELLEGSLWKNKSEYTGYLPKEEVAKILASADAVVLPLEDGSGVWNTTVHAVTDQGTFLLATSKLHKGYVKKDNVYYAKPNDVSDMKQALNAYIGKKNKKDLDSNRRRWKEVAIEHVEMYSTK